MHMHQHRICLHNNILHSALTFCCVKHEDVCSMVTGVKGEVVEKHRSEAVVGKQS